MTTRGKSTLSRLGRELGQFLLISALGFAILRLTQHLWQDPVTMMAGGALIVALMLLVKRDLAVTLTGLGMGIVGPLFEMRGVAAGAWSYSQTHVEGVPAWLFLLWGGIGIFIASLYEFLRSLIAEAQSAQGDGDGV